MTSWSIERQPSQNVPEAWARKALQDCDWFCLSCPALDTPIPCCIPSQLPPTDGPDEKFGSKEDAEAFPSKGEVLCLNLDSCSATYCGGMSISNQSLHFLSHLLLTVWILGRSHGLPNSIDHPGEPFEHPIPAKRSSPNRIPRGHASRS